MPKIEKLLITGLRGTYTVCSRLCECSSTSVGSVLLLCSMPCEKQTLQQYHTSHLVHSAKAVFFSDFLLILGCDERCTQLQGPQKAEEGLDWPISSWASLYWFSFKPPSPKREATHETGPSVISIVRISQNQPETGDNLVILISSHTVAAQIYEHIYTSGSFLYEGTCRKLMVSITISATKHLFHQSQGGDLKGQGTEISQTL